MEKIITSENIKKFAYVNENVCTGPIKGIVIWFNGLGYEKMNTDDDSYKEYGEKGILYVIPYNNPWSWMNKQAVSYTDEIIDVLIKKYDLDENIPIVSTGLSMGGLASLVYTAYSKRTPVACVANCPVCDLVFHFGERDDLPRTIYSALFNEEGTLADAMAKISPVHLADKMPKIKYHIFHCDEDEAVNIDSHSQKLVKALREKNHTVTFDVVHGRGHCQLTEEMGAKFEKYVLDSIEQ